MSRVCGPLSSLKVLDFSTLLPGPYATQILADLGAKVLRVESPSRPDLARITPPFVKNGISTVHAQINRNKDSVALNLKKKQSIDMIHKLIRDQGYDVIVEGFRPGVMHKLGLGFEHLAAINPAIIYVSITGYGQTGSFAQRAGHDINYLALSGLSSYTGAGLQGPKPFSTQVADIAGGSHNAVMGLLAAIVQRQAATLAGKAAIGQHVDISMADASFALNCMAAATSLFTGVSPKAGGEMLNGGNPCYNYYRTKDARYLSVGSLEPQFAAIFLESIGKPEWLQSLAGAMIADDGQGEAIRADIAEVIEQKTLDEWMTVFAGVDCCVEPVLTVLEAAEHPLFIERGMTIDVVVDDKVIKQVSQPMKFSHLGATSSTDAATPKGGGVVGADTERVLQKELGLSKAEIDHMKSEGCI